MLDLGLYTFASGSVGKDGWSIWEGYHVEASKTTLPFQQPQKAIQHLKQDWSTFRHMSWDNLYNDALLITQPQGRKWVWKCTCLSQTSTSIHCRVLFCLPGSLTPSLTCATAAPLPCHNGSWQFKPSKEQYVGNDSQRPILAVLISKLCALAINMHIKDRKKKKHLQSLSGHNYPGYSQWNIRFSSQEYCCRPARS